VNSGAKNRKRGAGSLADLKDDSTFVRRNIMKVLATVLIAAGISSLVSITAPARAAEAEPKSQITILYDAFGTDPSMTKDWG
jgi:hypothetical protein